MLQLINIEKKYTTGDLTQAALNGVSLNLRDSEFVAVLGPSGSGKTTLLNIIGGLDRYDNGELIINGISTRRYTDRDWDSYRNHTVGFVFQSYNLIPHQTVLANVELALTISGVSGAERRRRAAEALRQVGLGDQLHKRPTEMSGGQMQRVAIARALATNPKVLLCDEATSALDPKTTRQILELIGDINKKLGITVVIITHQMSVVKEVCNHVAILDDGEVVEEGLVSAVFSAPKSAAARHLVFPRGADIDVSDPQQQRRIRLIFRSAKTTSIPLVARLATEEGISATVISANTQKLSEEVYGSMLLGVPNAQFEQAMDFLRSIENLQVEEASVDVQ